MGKAHCHYCGQNRQATWDHIVPKALGGSNSNRNKVRSCQECNGRKGSTWPTCDCGKCDRARSAYKHIDPIMFARYESLRYKAKHGKDFAVN